ncbi:hypothetical protein SNE40_000904 [Patella caerulea]|uniref:Uncharacterized protein n=1 Tax=Patella caerulea TaxID=87958 RepID=A0AAN8KL41_PATCE
MYKIVGFLSMCLINIPDGVNLKKIRESENWKSLQPNIKDGPFLPEGNVRNRNHFKPPKAFRYLLPDRFELPDGLHRPPPENRNSFPVVHKRPPDVVSSYGSIIERVKTMSLDTIVDLVNAITYKLHLIANRDHIGQREPNMNVNAVGDNTPNGPKPDNGRPNSKEHHGPPDKIMQDLIDHYGIDIDKLSPNELHDLLHYLIGLVDQMNRRPPTFRPDVIQICCPIG